jgi:nitroreductase
MEDEIGLFEAMYTQRAIRMFKPDPVPDELLEKILGAATKAPSGANSQPWAFVVVRDEHKLEELAAIARRGFDTLMAGALSRAQPGDPPPMPNLTKMIAKVDDIPAWIIVCIVAKPGMGPATNFYSSIFPAVQNLLLAARGVGLGAVLTGLLGGAETPSLRAALGIPEEVEPVAFIPIGYPAEGAHYGPTTRRPLSEVVHWDGWDGQKTNSAKVAYRTGLT